MSSTKEATAKQPEVKRGGGGGSKATLEGVHWVAPGQKGDLEWMAKSNEYKDSLFVYPNNYRITGTQVWFTRMRPFNNAVGVDLLSSPAEEVLDTEKEAIDKAMKEVARKLKDKGYKRVFYTVNDKDDWYAGLNLTISPGCAKYFLQQLQKTIG